MKELNDRELDLKSTIVVFLIIAGVIGSMGVFCVFFAWSTTKRQIKIWCYQLKHRQSPFYKKDKKLHDRIRELDTVVLSDFTRVSGKKWHELKDEGMMDDDYKQKEVYQKLEIARDRELLEALRKAQLAQGGNVRDQLQAVRYEFIPKITLPAENEGIEMGELPADDNEMIELPAADKEMIESPAADNEMIEYSKGSIRARS